MGDRLRLVYTQVLCKPSWLVAAVLLRVKSEKGFRNVSSQRRWLKTCWQIDAPLSGQVTRGECKLCEYQTLKVGKHLHFKVHLAFLGFQMNLVILTVRWRLPSFHRNADIQILELAKLVNVNVGIGWTEKTPKISRSGMWIELYYSAGHC